MDLDQKLARDEAKIKARSDALLFFWGSCVANDESVRLLLKLYQLYQPYIFRQTRVVECFFSSPTVDSCNQKSHSQPTSV